jgi:hypothetical protein
MAKERGRKMKGVRSGVRSCSEAINGESRWTRGVRRLFVVVFAVKQEDSMDDREIRMECLKLASQSETVVVTDAESVVAAARL